MANQTGGVLWLDSDEEASAQMAGTALAKAAQQTVFWPQEAQFSAGIAEFYPSQVPPLRTDRDTIIIGKLESHDPQTLTVKADAQGKTIELSWNVAAERSNEDFSFLPKLVDMARDNGGLTLPTVGSAGLREVARVILAGAQELSIHDRPLPETLVTATTGTFHFCSYQEEPQDEPAAPAPPSDPAVPVPPAPAPVAVPPAPATSDGTRRAGRSGCDDALRTTICCRSSTRKPSCWTMFKPIDRYWPARFKPRWNRVSTRPASKSGPTLRRRSKP